MFCNNCGEKLNDNSMFCHCCGARISTGVQQTGYPQPMYQQPQVVYVEHKVPGRGIGIASMILGILGVLTASYMMIGVLAMSELFGGSGPTFAGSLFIIIFTAVVWFYGAAPSGLAFIFAFCSRKRGYTNGVSKSGLIMGSIGLALGVVTILIAVFTCI